MSDITKETVAAALESVSIEKKYWTQWHAEHPEADDENYFLTLAELCRQLREALQGAHLRGADRIPLCEIKVGQENCPVCAALALWPEEEVEGGEV